MKVALFDNKFFQKEQLPSKIAGSYTIKIQDSITTITIEEFDNNWCIFSNENYKLYENNEFINIAVLKEYCFYKIFAIEENKEYVLYVSPIYDNSYNKFCVDEKSQLSIGNSDKNNIVYNISIDENINVTATYNNGCWTIVNLSKCKIFYKNKIVDNSILIKPGNEIYIYGLCIYFIDNMVLINNPNKLLRFNGDVFRQVQYKKQELITNLRENYFLKSPRLKTDVDLENIEIDAPPELEINESDSTIMTYAPTIIMGLAYLITGSTSLINIIFNKSSIVSQLPTLAITFSMLFGMLIWPMVSSKYKKRKMENKRNITIKKYGEYLSQKEQIIVKNIESKRKIRMENYFSQAECIDIIRNRKKELWNREISSNDFLVIRVGIGNEELGFEVKYPEQKFTITENELLEQVKEIEQKYMVVDKIPILLSLYENNLVGIIDEFDNGHSFLNFIILQLIAYYGYDDVKFVTFTSKKNEKLWDYMKILPHSWNEERSFRYFASQSNEMKQISNELMDIYNYRINANDKDIPRPYYFIIIDNLQESRNLEIVKNVLLSKENYGFSILILEKTILNLPTECLKFINIGQKNSGIFEKELISNKQIQFANEMDDTVDMYHLSMLLANTKLSPINNKKNNLPRKLSFLELYNVGKIEQLNVSNRWETNNPIISLQAPIGIDSNGDLLNLDLHEKFHGPHGLIAGTTGSGKSEFIITYLLSLAVNYHPHEVSFILIDYKGGGLAGAFENSITNERIPHLIGTITNLDAASINRALVSIESELKRRQRIFNEARHLTNEGTIDIYKYQKMYRDKVVSEPMPSLFIVCDEFAELKSQQPEFMDQLISASRIGRSLGIHLILATQKPTGVVNDQIWSNSRFHICLKVQTESDSMEVIKKKDAAFIKDIGRLYLQVGNDELYFYGQSAYTGEKYIPVSGSYLRETSHVSFIDNVGYEYKKMLNKEKKEVTVDSSSELIVIVNYLIELGKTNNIKYRQLWLDPIPSIVLIPDLLKKYGYEKKKYELDCVLGEYDNPVNQSQHLLTLPLTKKGNTLIFGVTGSGKEKLLTTLIYSMITNYHTEEVNIYILDFGAEVLQLFKKAPQVSDYIINGNDEKIANLFKFIFDELEKRKKEFADYGGSYSTYIEKSQKSLPNLVIIINSYETFTEIYPNFQESLVKLSREGSKYGIIFVVTTSSIRNITYSLRQNFVQNIAMKVNDASEYYDVFGKLTVVPSDFNGRGLIELDSVYEFQTASICPSDDENEHILKMCLLLNEKLPKAQPIPVLPDIVSLKSIERNNDLSNVPIGIGVEDLKIVNLNLQKEKIVTIFSQDFSLISNFLRVIIIEIMKIMKGNVLILDLADYLEGIFSFENYINKNIESYLNKINNYNGNIVLFILGFSNMRKELGEDFKMFTTLLSKTINESNVKIVLVDEVNKVSACMYEEWYRQYINRQNGIFIGNGVSRQSVIQLTKFSHKLESEIKEDFGYYIINGEPKFIKVVITEEE